MRIYDPPQVFFRIHGEEKPFCSKRLDYVPNIGESVIVTTNYGRDVFEVIGKIWTYSDRSNATGITKMADPECLVLIRKI